MQACLNIAAPSVSKLSLNRMSRLGDQLPQQRLTLEQRGLSQIEAIEVEQIEPKGRHGQLLPQALDIQFASEAPHGDLEGLWPAVGLQADHFAVQDQILGGKRPREFHHLRDRGRYVL